MSQLEASVCRYCGYEFSEEEVEKQIEEVEQEVGEERELYKSDDHDTDDILSTHDFNNIGICEECEYTKAYVKANNYICPES